MKKKLLNNWGLKLASLLFAFILWLIVINMTDPIEPRAFRNIPVKLLHSEVLTDEGMVYEVLEGSGTVGTVTVTAPRSILEKLDESDITAQADLNSLTLANTAAIEFSSGKYKEYIKSISGSIDAVKLNIEAEQTARFVLKSRTTGEVAEGYLLSDITMDQNRVVVTGPESVVSKITQAVTEIDVSGATGDIATYSDVQLYDAEGTPVSASTLTKNFSTVHVNVTVLGTKTVPVEYQVMGTPALGYRATGVIESEPNEIRIAGNTEKVAAIHKITVPPEALNITGQNANMLTMVNVKEYLPEGITLADKGYDGKTAVTVYIEREVQKNLKLPKESVRVLNMPDNLEYEIEDVDTDLELHITGLAENISQVEANNLMGYVDMQTVLEAGAMEELKPGTYTCEVRFNLPEDKITLTHPAVIQLLVTEAER